MKKKITISLEESILTRIDESVQNWDGKNRSSVIEWILKERYWDFVDITCVILAHDNKWDNRKYPFSNHKALLEVKDKSIIRTQIETFSKSWITNYIITIPSWSRDIFKEELLKHFPFLHFELVELETDVQTWTALRKSLQKDNTNKQLLISNWDIYYWSLNFEEYYNYHKEQKSDFSLCLKFVLNPEQLWNVKIHGNKVIDFVEKPKASEMNLTNSWLYITSREFLDKNNYWEYLEKDYFPKLPEYWNTIWYIYSWEWEHIQNDSAYERINWWLI